ncbi:alpha/beta fold hydrolase [Sandaracinus amylolyticus]|uniref:Beta-ketoadipate enol-lactone hydrolase n=1 Tax=Sandaracinus amylolyticus TaxID=927083 RepID=A0A0F6YL30_9BACT|nr:alpha/beta fold hydrolase [Sandaracinus amylolyticus]AKF09076.1 Beta-ketoadipate enol-lactone hydrolase [Sandaracinus amylolyticus]
MTTTHFAQRSEGRLAYVDQGPSTAPAVLCLPSLGDTRAQYRRIAPRLLDTGARVLAADLRGHGESDATFARHDVRDLADDLVAVLDAARVERAVIAGSSISGAAALLAAARHPERIAGLLLLGPVARDLPLRRVLRPLFRPLFGAPWGPTLWSAYYRSLFKRHVPEDLDAHRATLRAMLGDRARRHALVELLRSDRRDVEQSMSAVRAPVAIVMGSADPDFPDPRAEVAALERALTATRVRTTTLEGVGHYPHLEDPDAVLAAYRALVAGASRTVEGVAS